jgi:hypothetical protein
MTRIWHGFFPHTAQYILIKYFILQNIRRNCLLFFQNYSLKINIKSEGNIHATFVKHNVFNNQEKLHACSTDCRGLDTILV